MKHHTLSTLLLLLMAILFGVRSGWYAEGSVVAGFPADQTSVPHPASELLEEYQSEQETDLLQSQPLKRSADNAAFRNLPVPGDKDFMELNYPPPEPVVPHI